MYYMETVYIQGWIYVSSILKIIANKKSMLFFSNCRRVWKKQLDLCALLGFSVDNIIRAAAETVWSYILAE